MTIQLTENHTLSDDGNPAGGTTRGNGIDIRWQDGPLGEQGARRPANGAFVEDVMTAALGRLHFYQTSPFNCRENALAITKLEEALHWLQARTMNRQERGVEGTYQV